MQDFVLEEQDLAFFWCFISIYQQLVVNPSVL